MNKEKSGKSDLPGKEEKASLLDVEQAGVGARGSNRESRTERSG